VYLWGISPEIPGRSPATSELTSNSRSIHEEHEGEEVDPVSGGISEWNRCSFGFFVCFVVSEESAHHRTPQVDASTPQAGRNNIEEGLFTYPGLPYGASPISISPSISCMKVDSLRS
jgi:hypothetical protein